MRIAFPLGLVALCVLPARGNVTQLPQTVVNALTPIDTLPTKSQLNDVFAPDQALDRLKIIVTDPNQDFGIQLRAIRALPAYCPIPPIKCLPGTLAHDTLIQLIDAYPTSPHAPQDTLRLRAAIEALGIARSGDQFDVAKLTPHLNHANRDVRAAVARALGNICNTQADTALRNRYTVEPTEQVKLAISTALRDLKQCVN
jgi:hypothetical protein